MKNKLKIFNFIIYVNILNGNILCLVVDMTNFIIFVIVLKIRFGIDFKTLISFQNITD